jgi:uroporphyrin-III C-methyltransferase / precorrin-2 dehydrogenase / sirohydrochlorin ferrochelatase
LEIEMETAKRGRVTLVGAGPGDPELLTVKAVRALAECDLVLYDALVPAAVVALARAMAIPVGKRAGKRSTPQEVINRLMIRAAKRGRHVVRLKCGDPFVFGRGGEEMIALREAGIPVEIVPGLTSAIAAPASVGVPVTHRGLASGFVVLTGHPEDTWRDVVARLTPRSLTLVLMMSLGARGAIAGELTRHGWAASTPALIVLGATHAGSWSWRGTLGELGAVVIPVSVSHLAGTIVVGDVASFAQVSAGGSAPITLAGGAA